MLFTYQVNEKRTSKCDIIKVFKAINKTQKEPFMSIVNTLSLESNRQIKINFDGGDLSFDAGLLLTKEFVSKLAVRQNFQNQWFCIIREKATYLVDELDEITKNNKVDYAVAYGEFMYKAGSWPYERRVVCKVEKPENQMVYMYTFVVTNMDASLEVRNMPGERQPACTKRVVFLYL